jgi:hypothetical protein
MAYNTKYRFRFESVHGMVYEVRLMEDGYSGSVTDRPLGKAPVIRMQESDPFRPTSCDLTLECQVEGEYVDLYTTDPFKYKISVYHKTGASSFTCIWEGYVATELYSEPDIAPPYDVSITATDGLGILKEYDFEPVGFQTVREHLVDLLKKTGDSHPYIYTASRLREYGETDRDFLDVVSINLDYLAGKSCYDVLGELLRSMRCVITYHYYWLIIREVDVNISSSGVLTVMRSSDDYEEATVADTLPLGKTVGKMGVAQMWPNGYLTRRVVPAKKSVKVTADWNLVSGASDLDGPGWTATGDASSSGKPRSLGTLGGTGTIFTMMPIGNFTMDVKVTVKCWGSWTASGLYGAPWVQVRAMYGSSNTGFKYFHPDTGWTADSPATGEEHTVDRKNFYEDPAQAEEITVTIPGTGDTAGGGLYIYVDGHEAIVYDVDVELVTMRGYEDTIIIDNGARGTAPDLSITGGREIDAFFIPASFAQGIWAGADGIATEFSDGSRIGRDWMSLTALAYAKEHAAPRIEITGKLDNPAATPMSLPPMFIKSHGVWALLSTYDWDLGNEDIDFKAVTLPTATLTVDSETITSH